MKPYPIHRATLFVTLFLSMFLSACKVASTTTTTNPVDNSPLTIVSTTPVQGTTGVNAYSSISVQFNVDVDPDSVTASSFLTDGITGNITVSGNVVTLVPSDPYPLPSNTTYNFSVVGGTGGIKSLTGKPLSANYDFSFTTETPANCADANVLCVDDTAGATQEYSTIQAAVDAVSAGQTIVVHNGTYAGFAITADGTPVSRITIKANGNSVLINQPAPGYSYSVLLSNASYVTVDGFIVEHNGGSGYAFAARNASAANPMRGLVISNNTVRNAVGTCLYLSQVADSLVEKNITYGSTGSHGIYLSNAGSDNTILRGNISYNNAKNGIHLNGDARNGGDGLHKNITLDGNILYDNAGNGMDLDGMYDSVVMNNLVYNNGRHSLRVFQVDASGGAANITVINNTFASGSGGWAIKFSQDNGGHVFFNNILLTQSGSLGAISVDNTNFTSDHNAVTGRFSVNNDNTILSLGEWQALGHGASSFASSRSELFNNAGAGDFTLMEGVPAIDAGVASYSGVAAPSNDIVNTVRPQRTTHDLGAYEKP